MRRNKSTKGFISNMLAAACAVTLCVSTASADDTEVFFGQVDPNLDIFPNVLFVLDTSGSMNWYDEGATGTRLERMKDALDVILDNTANVNVGIMRFNGSSGGGSVLFPITPIDKEICDQGDCGLITAVSRIGSANDDAEENITNNAVSLGGDILSMGLDDFASNTPQAVGLRFNKINVPQGATITSAWIEFTAHKDDTNATEFVIKGELSDDTVEFGATDGDVSGRPTTAASVNWTPNDWTQGLTYNSEPVTSVLQEIVNQTGWCGGNSLSMIITDTGSGTRAARSFNQSPTDAPALRYTYDTSSIPVGGGCTKKTLISAINASSDDAEQRTSNGSVNLNSSDLELPRDGNRQQLVGLRFNNVDIPKNAIITEASIEFEVDRTRNGAVSMNIQGQAHDNPPTFQQNRWNISNRARTQTVQWNNLPVVAQNGKMLAENLEPIAQELVNRSGWESGNSMVFIFSRRSGNAFRELESYNGEQANAPKLRIVYRAFVGNADQQTFITARDKLKEVVNGLTATGGTPVVDAYYEASQYMRGDPVDYGTQRGYNRSRYHRVSTPDSYTGGSVYRDSRCTDGNLDHWSCYSEQINGNPVYKSPLKSSCQTNHIVFLSDGAATSNSAAQKVRNLTGVDTCDINLGPEACGQELAHWLNDTDHVAGMIGKQNISTYTIGFNFSGTFLPSLANAGGGSYFQADSAEELVNVFKDILGDVLSVDTSFVAPGATVNQFNRLTHRSDIYFALFKPDTQPTWAGNLKRYTLGIDDATGEVTVMDANTPPQPAVDQESGFFRVDSKSEWSSTTDGNNVSSGGAAEQLTFTSAAPRRVFTYVGSNDAIPNAGINLSSSGNYAVSENNGVLTNEVLAIDTLPMTDAELAAHRENLIKWARGIDVKDENDDSDTTDWRQAMGDPMHARPVIVNYASTGDPLSTIFVGTNEGYLHAIESQFGTEVFSFVPQELLPNFQTFYDNQSSDKHPYGLDGTLSVWTTDTNENVTIDPGEKAYIYTGMRRGGKNLYAFDVSDRINPKLAWVIEGGKGEFSELGQTWSKAIPTKIMYNNQELNVLIFGAGYDTNQDTQWITDPVTGQLIRAARTPDSVGRGFFIVNAETGERIYNVSGGGTADQIFANMNYSVPSDLRILDVDLDGFADQIYFGDMGGQIWRFDIQSYHQSGELMTGGVIANLSEAGIAGERRFYYEPDVAVISDNGNRFLSISIGSGWRAHPLDTFVDDQFFMLKNHNVFSKPSGYGKSTDGINFVPVVPSDLVDVTTYIEDQETNEFGWKLDMTAGGEKILGDSVTVNNQIIFTSYRPALAVGACTTAIGGGTVYTVSVLDGSPTIDMNEDGVIDEKDREKELDQGGIPPEPAALITENGPTVLVGPEQPIKPDWDDLTQRTFWVDVSDNE